MPNLVDELLRLESTDDTPGTPCSCGKAGKTTRCAECPRSDLKCDECFLQSHEGIPFHHVEKWNGHFFAKGSQSQIGRVLYIGHCHKRCPSLNPNALPSVIDIVDVTGIHPMRVEFCNCKNKEGKKLDRWRQLIRLGLIPATMRRPSTACTVGLMKLHHLLTSIGKISTMDFAYSLRRLTDGGNPESLPVSYKLFDIYKFKQRSYYSLESVRSDTPFLPSMGKPTSSKAKRGTSWNH